MICMHTVCKYMVLETSNRNFIGIGRFEIGGIGRFEIGRIGSFQ